MTETIQHLRGEIAGRALTRREIEALQHFAEGHTSEVIGAMMALTTSTVLTMLAHIRQKLGARDKTHAVAIAIRRGLIE